MVPVVPPGQQHPLYICAVHIDFDQQGVVNIACAVWHVPNTTPKPTFRFGKREGIKNAEIWD